MLFLFMCILDFFFTSPAFSMYILYYGEGDFGLDIEHEKMQTTQEESPLQAVISP